MALRIPWDERETALLIDAYIRVKNKELSQRDAVGEISKLLRRRAILSGIEIDDIFRNENGISMQMKIIQGLIDERVSGLHSASKLFVEMTDLYKTNRYEFDKILLQAKGECSMQVNVQEEFFTWLSTRISSAQLSELYIVCSDIENYCLSKHILAAPLFETTDIVILQRVSDMVVFKDLQQNNFISSFKLPSFMRDYVVKNFQDDDGEVDVEGASIFISTYIPKKDDWKNLKNRIINNGEIIKILAKVCIEIDIRTGEISFALPDFGLGYKDTTIPRDVWNACSEALLKAEENWGIIELGYQYPYNSKTPGKIKLMDFTDFCPYETDLEEFKSARESFSLDEWIDIVLSAVDYNPAGYESRAQKLSVVQRLLPFVEKNLNLIELAPPGTGKSYLFGQISRYGWLVSGKVTRAKLIYDIGKKTDGIVAYKDFVALDEIREAEYMKDTELHSALQQIMENRKYNAPDGHEVNVDAGIVFLGNIAGSAMDEYSNMFFELPEPFHKVPFLDRIHGFIKGWDLPRMNDDLKAFGWALNSEYFSSIMHELRDDPSYRAIVDARIEMPPKADTRDTEAIKRICTAYLKLLFPHVRRPQDITSRDFNRYCLQPAMDMRAIIRIQMGIADEKEAGKTVPSFSVIDA